MKIQLIRWNVARSLRRGLERPVSRPAAEAISERLRILGQPLRVRLIDLLDREGEMPVGVLADMLGERIHNVSQHLGVLRSAAVVSRRHRGCEAWYRLSSPAALYTYERVARAIREEAQLLERAVEAPDGYAPGTSTQSGKQDP